MNGSYVGVVAGADPLKRFLTQVLDVGPRPVFHAFRLHGTNEVYAYEEQGSGFRVVCKFYGPLFGWDRDRAAWMAIQEYRNLELLRGLDRAFDVGRVAGELQHAFLVAGRCVEEAQPFVAHFLRAYAAPVDDRVPYYTGLNLLRIAGNSWVGDTHAGILVSHAVRAPQVT